MDAAITNLDYSSAGATFGYWLKNFLQTELPAETDTATYYNYVGYL